MGGRNWRPAILLRFPLQTYAGAGDDRAGEKVYEVSGTPQGERYFLDRLDLFSQGGAASKVDSVSFHFEVKPGDSADPIADWTIARTNLTEEARPGNRLRHGDDVVPRPYVARKTEPLDVLRLLQMLSITNSGGYYLRVPSAVAYATLVVCVTLTADRAAAHETISLPWRRQRRCCTMSPRRHRT